MIKLNTKWLKIISLTAVFLATILIISIFIAYQNYKPNDRITLVQINGIEIKVEVASQPFELYTGLSNRQSLCDTCGMLFIFKDSAERKFVMRNMNFPLDIIFINNGKIIKIAENLEPEGESPQNIYSSDQPADRVLELNTGFAALHQLQIGDLVKY